MTQDDSRAFRPHLRGRDLNVAQERLVAAIVRCPGLLPTVRAAGVNRQHFQPDFRAAFDFVVGSDRDRILRAVQSGGEEVGRLFRLAIELSHGQALHLARQISESIAREQLAQRFLHSVLNQRGNSKPLD
jgi:hypothetical protein